MKKSTDLAASSVIIMLSMAMIACGGGGGDGGGSSSPSLSTQSIAGIWEGTLTSTVVHQQYSVIGIISESGTARFVNATWGAQYSATVDTNGNSFSANTTAYAPFGGWFPNGSTVGAVTLSGTFTTKGSIVGTYSGVGDSGSYSLRYNSLYEMPSSLPTIAGTWSAPIYTDTETLTIDLNGDITGSSTTGCTFAGHVSIIDSAYNAYEITIVIDHCGQENGTYSGLATITDPAKNTAVVSVSSAAYSYVRLMTKH